MTRTAYAPGAVVRQIKSRKIVYRKMYTAIAARFRFRVVSMHIYMCNIHIHYVTRNQIHRSHAMIRFTTSHRNLRFILV